MSNLVKTVNASLVVIGTSIGAGILGLPVDTGRGGFVPALFSLIIMWAIMTATALMLVEVLSKSEKQANFFTLAEKNLGSFFKILTFFVYIMLYLSLTLAYTKGGGIFLSDSFSLIRLPVACLIFLVSLTPLILFGTKVLNLGNSGLTFIMALSFFVILGLGIGEINPSFLTHVGWKSAFFSFPMLVTSFGFHNVIPSLYSYVDHKKRMRIAIIVGTTTTFFVYLVWQLFVMGVVPLDGENSLKDALARDQTAIFPLRYYIKGSFFNIAAILFYFSALTTSFLGVGLGLIDFLLDSFKIKRTLLNRVLFVLMVYFPALLLAQTKLRIFYISLKYGAGFACTYLLIFFPTVLFIVYRRKKKRSRFS